MSQHLALIVGGELPCSKEEAAILAAISMRLDDAWPHAQSRLSAQCAGPAALDRAAQTPGQSIAEVPLAPSVAEPDECDGGEREHERVLNEFLNKHRKLDRSLVRPLSARCSSSTTCERLQCSR